MVNDHCIELVRVTALDRRAFVMYARQERIHSLWIVHSALVILVTIDFFISQLSIQIVLIKRKCEWELNVVGQLALELIEAFHLNDKDARHYFIIQSLRTYEEV